MALMPKGIYDRKSANERFDSMIETVDDCYLWTGPLSSTGYANFWFEGRYIGAHVFAWMRVHGPVPGQVVRHGPCRTRHCVRVEHLAVGTKGDNNRDRTRDGTQARGSACPHSVLTEDQVAEARRLHAIGVPWARIARDFGVKPGTLYAAGTKRDGRWSHLP
jgi:hypothetical protein